MFELTTGNVKQLNQSLPAIDLTLDEQILTACDDIWYSSPANATKKSPTAKIFTR